MNEYKGFKIGDKVRHKFRDKQYQNCEIIEISERRLPLIKVSIDGNLDDTAELPYMDLQLLNK